MAPYHYFKSYLLKLFDIIFLSFFPLQEELSKRITGLIAAFPKTKDALRFVNIFLVTHAREWHGIDKLRLDKFLLV